QRVVTSPQIRLRQDVEGALQGSAVAVGSARSTEFQLSEAEGYTQLSKRGGGSDPQNVIQTRLVCPWLSPCGDVEIIADHLARQMDGGNAQPACANLRPHVESLPLIGF